MSISELVNWRGPVSSVSIPEPGTIGENWKTAS
jgi:hypothetical protein